MFIGRQYKIKDFQTRRNIFLINAEVSIFFFRRALLVLSVSCWYVTVRGPIVRVENIELF